MLSEIDRATAQRSLFFGSLPDDDFQRVLSRGRVVELERTQTLFRQMDPASHVFVVLEGLIRLSVSSVNGTDVVVSIFHPGTSFAEALAFGRSCYPVTASGLVRSRVLAVPNDAVLDQLNMNPAAMTALLSAAYAHLHQLVQQVQSLKSSTGFERLAQYVYSLLETTDGNSAEIPYEKQALAGLLGMTPESLSRAFRRLEEYGVTIYGHQVVRVNDSRLQNYIASLSYGH